jgi:hypothetical protein
MSRHYVFRLTPRGRDDYRDALTQVLTDEVILEQLPKDQHGRLTHLLGILETAIEHDAGGQVTPARPVDDPVNHPSHYTGFANGAEVIDIIEGLAYSRGAAIKYLARAGRKEIADELEDLRKAEWYVKHEIERVQR